MLAKYASLRTLRKKINKLKKYPGITLTDKARIQRRILRLVAKYNETKFFWMKALFF